MPAVYVDDVTVLPRIPVLPDKSARERPVQKLVSAPKFLEGEGFEVRRAFSEIDLALAYPFLLLDHMGAVEYSPGEAKGAPDHPHRGFETVTYMLDGELEHRDSNGGGGVITGGATQWMTAGAGIVHSEMPTELLLKKGGLFHGVQLWVNLPSKLKWTPPQYQDLKADSSILLASDDGGAMVRLIAGELAGFKGPGSTHTPITYAHVSISPGARLQVPWPANFNAMIYVLAGKGSVGPDRQPIHEGQLAVLGEGEQVSLYSDSKQDNGLPHMEALLLGGLPIREQIAWRGPFVMNTQNELYQTMNDYHAGRMGTIPAKRAGDEVSL